METTGISIEKVVPSLPRNDIRALRFLNPCELPSKRFTARFHRLLFPMSKPFRKWCHRETIAAVRRPCFVEAALGYDMSVALDVSVRPIQLKSAAVGMRILTSKSCLAITGVAPPWSMWAIGRLWWRPCSCAKMCKIFHPARIGENPLAKRDSAEYDARRFQVL